MSRLRVAIGEHLQNCSQVITLGVRSQIVDYTQKERELLRAADIIFFPTARFADLFATLGKVTFPSVNCYRLRGERLKQVALLRMLEVPYPRTRVYYGQKQKQKILDDFALPFIAKNPLSSAVGKDVFLIEGRDKLQWYNKKFNPAYIQEQVIPQMELLVVVVNYQKVFGSYRWVAGEDSRGHSHHGTLWQTKDMPSEAITLGKNIACQGGLSEVTVAMIFDGSQFQVVELTFQCDQGEALYTGHERLKTILEMIEGGEL
jgi:ribosomal protein S6--L-glutamate ligase